MASKYTGVIPGTKKNSAAGSNSALPDDSRPPAKNTVASSASKLLDAMWRSDNSTHFISVRDPKNGSFRNQSVANVAMAIELANQYSSKGMDVYFACAEYLSAENRKESNVAGAYGFWFDIDIDEDKSTAGKGYHTTEEAEPALSTFCTTANIPLPTHTVLSGGGLHVYWALTERLDAQLWKTMAAKLKELAKILSFFADPSRTSDIASVLRFPGTDNYKTGLPRPVTLKASSDQYIEQEAMLDAINSAHDKFCKPAKPLPTAKKFVKAFQCLPEETGQRQTCIEQLATIKDDFFKNTSDSSVNSWSIGRLAALLKHIDPEEGGHDAWVRVGMAIHTETEGSDEGLALFDQWSSAGATYPGRRTIEAKWRSFASNREDRCNRGTLINRVKAAGHDWMAICSAEEEPFEQCEGEVVYPDGTVAEPVNSTRADTGTSNPLEQYSLLGKTAEIEKLAIEEKHLLGRLAVLGQLTVFYAAPNTGKTLIVLFLLMDAIRQGRINASKVFYINVDDTLNALLQKLYLADESGFHMLAEGHEEFKVTMFVKNLEEMIANDQATGIVIILDTIKRFTELMDKKRVSQFTQLCRRFTMKGGTLIALAHANKHPGADGKPIYAGTSDVVDDFDCAYTIAPLSKTAPGSDKVVVFENIKRRGNVELRAAYSYSDKIEQSYNALLASVQEVDDVELLKLNVAEPSIPDTVIVDAIIECICKGINTRMALAREAANRAGVSRRKAMQVIERYTGLEPLQHKWLFTVGDRGANVFSLLAITAKP